MKVKIISNTKEKKYDIQEIKFVNHHGFVEVWLILESETIFLQKGDFDEIVIKQNEHTLKIKNEI